MDISIQTSGLIRTLGREKAFRLIREAGFSGIDWNVNLALTPDTIRDRTYREGPVFGGTADTLVSLFEQELALIRENGLKICQAHAPYPPCTADHPEILEDMIGVFKTYIEFSQRVGIPKLVIHGVSYPASESGWTVEEVVQINLRLHRALIPTLRQCRDVMVCTENIYTAMDGVCYGGICSDAGEAVSLIDTLNEEAGREAFGLCLDTGHLFLTRGNFRKYIPTLGKRIKALHLADNDGCEDLHLMPTTGKLPWEVICGELKKIGYSGALNFETYTSFNCDKGASYEYIAAKMNLTRQVGEMFRHMIEG